MTGSSAPLGFVIYLLRSKVRGRAGSDWLGCEFDSKSYSSSELGLLCPAMFGSLQMSCPGLGPIRETSQRLLSYLFAGRALASKMSWSGSPHPRAWLLRIVLPTEPTEMNIPVPGFPEALFPWMRLLFEGKPGSPTKIPNPRVLDVMG